MRYLLPIMLILLAGCDGAVIDGVVIDGRDQALPGVAVRVEGTPYETLTNGRGEYRVRYVPNKELQVRFAKTGYTSFALPIEAQQDTKPFVAPRVRLAQLPEGPGVFLYENFDYVRTTFVTPDQLKRKSDATIVFGTLRKDLTETLKRAPSIGIYRGYQIPVHGIRMNRLEETEVLPLPGYSGSEGNFAWTRGPEIAIDIRPVDSSDKTGAQLLQVWFPRELDYGAYAIHWGALDGDAMSEERRMFCFKVVETLTPPEKIDDPTATDATTTVGESAESAPAEEVTAPAEDDEG
ncbi:MAG TPA: carboxypeptidase-like regulatory domain-containing protein [Candidatus Hydrogenedentes bacterium]|nr:carboxypeptidase-like regulatory domain-containing protein [Candidatus Hydrogenedentota bacterium]